jgi:hypothetical protein
MARKRWKSANFGKDAARLSAYMNPMHCTHLEPIHLSWACSGRGGHLAHQPGFLITVTVRDLGGQEGASIDEIHLEEMEAE